MGQIRKNYDNEFKARVVLESLQKTVTQEKVMLKYGISASILHRWRNQFLDNAHKVFDPQKPTTKPKEMTFKANLPTPPTLLSQTPPDSAGQFPTP
jgi:transposase-like protein